MNEKNVKDNKKFWKTVKPLLSDKSVSREKTNLIENEKALTSESKTTETLNNFFSNIVKKLEIPKFDSNDLVTENIKDPVFKAISKYENHRSILVIQKYKNSKIFHFQEVKIGEIRKEILKLDQTKTLQKTDIPTRIIKENIDIFAEFLCMSINGTSKSASLPFFKKLADFTTLHKKGRKDLKGNFRPVSFLPILSKKIKKYMFAQMSTFYDNIFSNQQCCFQKGYSA